MNFSNDMDTSMMRADREPDPDSEKMFIGQIPRTWEEEEIRKMLEEFGSIHELNILRDKATQQSKGCCFVLFHSRQAALNAQSSLHNQRSLPGMAHPVQMKPADSEKRIEERKLFIGMIPKSFTESDLRSMFAEFGTIEDCTVLRNPNGESKGCAFLTFPTKICAQNAIKQLHNSQTMQDQRMPLVVKYADSPSEKEMKRVQYQMKHNPGTFGTGMASNAAPNPIANLAQMALMQQLAGSNNFGGIGTGGGFNAMKQQVFAAAAAQAVLAQNNPSGAAGFKGHQSNVTPSSSNYGNWGGASSSYGTGDVNSSAALQGLAALAALAGPALSALTPQNLALLQQLSSVNNQSGNQSSLSAANSPSSSSMASGGFGGYGGASGAGFGSAGGSPGSYNGSGFKSGSSSAAGGNQQYGLDALSQAFSGIQQYAASFPNAFNPSAQQSSQMPFMGSGGKHNEGPDGANLFVYHIPAEFSDSDLWQMFTPFGTVVSAKVFVDKLTNLSKCFGFVSFDSPSAAQTAIAAMNGFQIGMKRLKVQLKRAKNDKPY